MQNGTAISIAKMGNGFSVVDLEPLESMSGETLVFESKKKLIRFIDSHFAEKRKKGEKGE